MKRTKEQSIQDALQLFLRSSGLETPLLQHRLIQAWPTVVGKEAASQTRAERIYQQTLWVKVDSATLRAHLYMQRQQIVRKLNETVKSQLINDLKLY